MPQKKNKEEIIIPEQISVFTDKKTQVKTMALPFTFPTQIQGIISVTKLDKFGWRPNLDIEKITIHFKNDDDKAIGK